MIIRASSWLLGALKTLAFCWGRYVIYLAVFVVGFGGLGFWIPFIKYRMAIVDATEAAVFANLATYIVAIAVTAFADYLVAESTGEDHRTRALWLFSLTLFAAIPATIVILTPNRWLQLHCSQVGAVAAALVWMLVNGQNPNLVDANPIATLGGDVQ